MEAYLARRGRVVEALIGFRRERVLALLPPRGLVLTGVALPAGDDGAVRARLAGAPGALIEVGEDVWVDAAGLARSLPRCLSELVRRTSTAQARALVDEPVLLEVLAEDDPDQLARLIARHEIHADDLHLLGEEPPRPSPLAGPLRFALGFERGTLSLAYGERAYEELHERADDPRALAGLDVVTTWRDAALPLDVDLPWHDEELAELAVIANMGLDGQPARVVDLLDACFPDGVGDLEVTETLGIVLNLWAVALRRTGDLERALGKADEALAVAEAASPALAQEVVYNRGYTRLQGTMSARHGRDGPGLRAFTSDFELCERHRATWEACLADFERALQLDPDDEAAASQVALTEKLLGLLDLNARAPRRSAPPPAEADRSREGPQSEGGGLWTWLPPVIVIALLSAFVFGVARCEPRGEPRGEPATSRPPALDAGPPPWERARRQRVV